MTREQCRFEGCRQRPRRSSEWCTAHPGGQAPLFDDDPPQDDRKTRRPAPYAAYVPVVALEEALELPPGDLRREIAVVRAVLAELLKAGLAEVALVTALDRATGALVRLLRANQQLTAEQAGEVEAMMGRVLQEMGQGGDTWTNC